MKIIKTNLLPRQFGAMTLWPYVLIRPEQVSNKALLAHEQVHYDEQARTAWAPVAALVLAVLVADLSPWWFALLAFPGVLASAWWLPYIFIERFCLNAEIRAFRVELAHPECRITKWWVASEISSKYCPSISKEQAYQLLSELKLN